MSLSVQNVICCLASLWEILEPLVLWSHEYVVLIWKLELRWELGLHISNTGGDTGSVGRAEILWFFSTLSDDHMRYSTSKPVIPSLILHISQSAYVLRAHEQPCHVTIFYYWCHDWALLLHRCQSPINLSKCRQDWALLKGDRFWLYTKSSFLFFRRSIALLKVCIFLVYHLFTWQWWVGEFFSLTQSECEIVFNLDII